MGFDPDVWREDDYGDLMARSAHGNRYSGHGWEIDRFPVPRSAGGLDALSNLRPLHWRTNAARKRFPKSTV